MKPYEKSKSRCVAKKRNGGSLVVEAALVVSAVLFTLYLMIQGMMLLYQKVLLSQTASMAAQQGAEIWNDSRKAFSNGAWDDTAEEDPLYFYLMNDSLFGFNTDKFTNPYIETIRSIKDINSKIAEAVMIIENGEESLQNRKFARIRVGIYKNLRKYVLKPQSIEIRIEYENLLYKKNIKVSVEHSYKTPYAGLVEIFGGNGLFKIKASYVSAIVEQPEFIRNVDFGVEYATKIGREADLFKLFDDMRKKVQGY